MIDNFLRYVHAATTVILTWFFRQCFPLSRGIIVLSSSKQTRGGVRELRGNVWYFWWPLPKFRLQHVVIYFLFQSCPKNRYSISALYKLDAFSKESLHLRCTEVLNFRQAYRIILNCIFYNNDDLFELISIVNCYILSSNLHVIVSEFYDLDVGTVKNINILPKRLSFPPSARPGWNLKQVAW